MHFKRLVCRVKHTMDVTPCLAHKALVEYNCCAGYRRPQTSSSLKVKGIFALSAGHEGSQDLSNSQGSCQGLYPASKGFSLAWL